MKTLQLQEIHKYFDNMHVIKGVDLQIDEGEFVVFVGPSGCGKSTMLRLIAGLEDVTSGTIRIKGTDVTALGAAQRGLAMVFQSYALYPHMTVRENMGFGLKVANTGKAELDKTVKNAATILQLEPLLDRKPKELSGGQRQRVAIGRALVRQPAAFLFDEPLSNLDAALRVQMRIEIGRLHKKLGKTMIYVTHDQVEAMTLADRIIVFNEGIIQQQGSPLQLYAEPSNLFVATFIGSPKMNILPCKAVGKGVEIADGVNITIPGAANARYLGIRPEHIQLCPIRKSKLHGIVTVTESLGSDTFVYLDIDNVKELVCVRVTGSSPLALEVDDLIGLQFDMDNLHLFDSSGQRVK